MRAAPPLFWRVLRTVADWKLRIGSPFRARRDRAFDEYYRNLLVEFASPPASLPLLAARPVTPHNSVEGTFELRFQVPRAWRMTPGDLLQLGWQNPPEWVDRILQQCGEGRESRVEYRTPASILEPPRVLRAPAGEILSSRLEIDPFAPTERSLQRLVEELRPLRPRLYTVSRIHGDEVEVLVRRGPREPRPDFPPLPGRAGGWLSTRAVGELVPARRMPHPHRLPVVHGHGEQGIAVVTGSAVSGAIVHLRAGMPLSGVWLIWGIRERRGYGYYEEELRGYVSRRMLARFDLVESRPAVGVGSRVDAFVAEHAGEIQALLLSGGWGYVSGQEAMAEAVRKALACKLTADDGSFFQNAGANLRWIESCSG